MYFLSNTPKNIVPKIITAVITEVSITIIFLLFVFIDISPLNFAMTAVLYRSQSRHSNGSFRKFGLFPAEISTPNIIDRIASTFYRLLIIYYLHNIIYNQTIIEDIFQFVLIYIVLQIIGIICVLLYFRSYAYPFI